MTLVMDFVDLTLLRMGMGFSILFLSKTVWDTPWRISTASKATIYFRDVLLVA